MNDYMQIVEVLFYYLLSLTFLGTLKHYCVIKTREMFSFLPLIDKSFTIELRFLLLSISTII